MMACMIAAFVGGAYAILESFGVIPRIRLEIVRRSRR